MALKRNIAANYLGRVYSIGSIFIFTPFYIKALGIESYGLIAFYSIILTVGALADVGLSASFSREAARQPDRRHLLDLLATIERALIALTAIFALGVVAAADLIAEHWFNAGATVTVDEIARALRLMALTVVPQLAVSLYVSGLLGLQRQGLGNAVQALYVTLRGGLVIPALYALPSLDLFFAWQLSAGLILMAVARVTLVRAMGFGPFAHGRASFTTLHPVMGFAGGMFALTLLSAITTQLDKIVVSKLFSIEEFGYYTLASTLAQLPVALISPLMMALLPRLTELGAANEAAQVSRLYDGFAYVVALLAGFSAFGLAFFAPEILHLWLGQSAVPETAVTLVRILAAGSLFLALGSTPFYLGLAHGHNRTSIVVGFLTLIVTIPLLLFGSRQFGLVGAALPWVVLHAANFLALAWNIHRHFYHGRFATLRWTVRPVLFSGLAVGASRLIADAAGAGPWGSCLIAAVVSGAAMLLLVLADRERLRPILLGR